MLALFKFDGQTNNCQTAKLKSPPNKMCIRYIENGLPVVLIYCLNQPNLVISHHPCCFIFCNKLSGISEASQATKY